MLGRAHCTCTCTLFGVGGLSDAPVVRKPVLGRPHCTRTCTVFGMDSLSDTPIVRRCVDAGVHTAFVLVQC